MHFFKCSNLQFSHLIDYLQQLYRDSKTIFLTSKEIEDLRQTLEKIYPILDEFFRQETIKFYGFVFADMPTLEGFAKRALEDGWKNYLITNSKQVAKQIFDERIRRYYLEYINEGATIYFFKLFTNLSNHFEKILDLIITKKTKDVFLLRMSLYYYLTQFNEFMKLVKVVTEIDFNDAIMYDYIDRKLQNPDKSLPQHKNRKVKIVLEKLLKKK